VLLGFGISVWLAQKDALPMRRLLSKLSSSTGSPDSAESPYDFIAGTMDRFVRDNASLLTLVENQRPLLVETFYERLLRGQFYDPSDVTFDLSLIGHGIPEGRFAVALLRIRGVGPVPSTDAIAQLKAAKLACRQVIAASCPHGIHVHSMDHDKLAVVFCAPGRDGVTTLLREELVGVADRLRERYRISVQAGVGGAQDQLIGVGSSYREAESALESADAGSPDLLVHFDAGHHQETGYFYPLEVEARLFNLIRVGKAPEAESVWADVFTRNFVGASLSQHERRELVSEIGGTLRKCGSAMTGADGRGPEGLGEELDRIREIAQPTVLDGAVRATVRRLCAYVQDRRHSHADRLRDEIIDYIREHHMDADLGLYSVASHFRLTEKYLSDFFKDKTGTNFLAHVQSYRMGRAKELIEQRDLSIQEVARMVGYTTNSSFTRAFKRFHGVSPSSLRVP